MESYVGLANHGPIAFFKRIELFLRESNLLY